jgi:hypothetical protein
MSRQTQSLVALIALAVVGTAYAAEQGSFSGKWTIDLRSASQRDQKLECGTAEFELTQEGARITGSHSMATVGCGRLNDGGLNTVKGTVVGDTAVLVVTSGRNGAIVLGTAQLSSGLLKWQVIEEIQDGEPATDSPLILAKGALSRVSE